MMAYLWPINTLIGVSLRYDFDICLKDVNYVLVCFAATLVMSRWRKAANAAIVFDRVLILSAQNFHHGNIMRIHVH